MLLPHVRPCLHVGKFCPFRRSGLEVRIYSALDETRSILPGVLNVFPVVQVVLVLISNPQFAMALALVVVPSSAVDHVKVLHPRPQLELSARSDRGQIMFTMSNPQELDVSAELLESVEELWSPLVLPWLLAKSLRVEVCYP